MRAARLYPGEKFLLLEDAHGDRNARLQESPLELLDRQLAKFRSAL